MVNLPAGTQTTLVGAAAGATVGAAVEYFVNQRGQLRKGGTTALAKTGTIGATTGALAVNAFIPQPGMDSMSRTRPNAFNLGAAGFGLGLTYSILKDTDNIIRNLAIGSITGGILGHLTDQYGLLGRIGRRDNRLA